MQPLHQRAIFLSKNNAALQKSLTRLSSGSRITQPADDAGGLAVSMKLSGTINRLTESKRILITQFLSTSSGRCSRISRKNLMDRMAEFKALSQDVLKMTQILQTTMLNSKTYRFSSIK